MKRILSLTLVLLVILAGCAMQPAKPAPEQPAAPAEEPAVAVFDPVSLCGKPLAGASNDIFSVRECGSGVYVAYRTCCGQAEAYVDAKGNAMEATADVKAECANAGENLCARLAENEPILCPGYDITACPEYYSPVCARIRDSLGESWTEYGNDCAACMEGKGTGGEVVYLRGTCASRGIETMIEAEQTQKNIIYSDIIGREIVLYAQHYGLAGREVRITIEEADITHIDKVTFDGQAAWRVTITREFEGIPRTVYVYYGREGKTRLGEQQLQ